MKNHLPLQILKTAPLLASQNMEEDKKLLKNLSSAGPPLLRFYQWLMPSITYGYFIDPARYLYLEQLEARQISLAQRPTGGGIVFHFWDVAFSFLLPAQHPRFSTDPLETYHFVNQAILEVIQEYFATQWLELTLKDFDSVSPSASSFCMAKPTRYDVICKGLKIAGAAQRRGKNGLLHQGTISLQTPCFTILEELIRCPAVLSAMKAHTFSPLGSSCPIEKKNEIEKEIAKRLAENLGQKL